MKLLAHPEQAGTCRVQRDILKSLQLRNPYTVISTFDRPNLFYGVKTLSRTASFRVDLANEVLTETRNGGSTIIYCTTIKDVGEVFFSVDPCRNQASMSVNVSFVGMSRFLELTREDWGVNK